WRLDCGRKWLGRSYLLCLDRTAWGGQSLAHTMIDKLVHCAPITKTHLDFGRMDIDIDQLWLDIEIQDERRMAIQMQHIAVSFPQGVGNQLIPDKAAIDKKILHIACGA